MNRLWRRGLRLRVLRREFRPECAKHILSDAQAGPDQQRVTRSDIATALTE
jgi:hypothetical protein